MRLWSYFNPPAPCGTGLCSRRRSPIGSDFNPPAPCGTGLRSSMKITLSGLFQSTRPLRDGTQHGLCYQNFPRLFQSTRPLRDGTCDQYPLPPLRHFNPPAPCGTGPMTMRASPSFIRFQSTRPLRDGTSEEVREVRQYMISIHPPLAGRDLLKEVIMATFSISIHPPLAGRDFCCRHISLLISFQSTRPLRDGTKSIKDTQKQLKISIHPPLAGRDS